MVRLSTIEITSIWIISCMINQNPVEKQYNKKNLKSVEEVKAKKIYKFKTERIDLKILTNLILTICCSSNKRVLT
ncbi:hypothetical protein [Riemerella anatipestifer]|uniref:hypothetical protein n=1 Tax=Riemerella anatipestifer TaxID=34085 RepID=UPI00129E8322|nr:hypothetical protein [Riemerella anatipestifer]